jgi:hypothetical protein
MGAARALERYAWIGGVVYVVALITESALSLGFKISQDDSAAKIANSLDDHNKRLILVFCLCILYVAGFVIYLTRLDDLLRRASNGCRFFFSSWVLIGGVLFVTLHGVSDVGIYGLLAGKVAAYSAQQQHGLSYTLYLLTFALDSVGDVFGSFFMLGSGLVVLTTACCLGGSAGSPLRPARSCSCRRSASAESSPTSGLCSIWSGSCSSWSSSSRAA